MHLDYAEEFAIDNYSGGCALISISDGSRFLVVPEGKETPENLDEDIVVLKQPVDHIYMVATAVMDMFLSLIHISCPYNHYEGPEQPKKLIVAGGTGRLYCHEAIRRLEVGDEVGLLSLATVWPVSYTHLIISTILGEFCNSSV